MHTNAFLAVYNTLSVTITGISGYTSKERESEFTSKGIGGERR